MNEYFALLIPVITSILLLIFFNHRITWWEGFLPTIVCLVLIFSMKSCDKAYNTSDTEYWSFPVKSVSYEEEWDEWIEQTCSRQVACGQDCNTDSKGNTTCTTRYCTEYYDCSYRDYHPAEYYITNNQGNTYSITQVKYKYLRKIWGNNKYVNMYRDYYRIDGDKFVSYWNNKKETLITTTEEHSYENRVQTSSSIYNYEQIDEEDKIKYDLFDYPVISNYEQLPVLSKGYEVTKGEQNYVNTINALLGSKKEVHVFICIWKNKPSNIAFKQKAYWKGSNKNEIVICIGLDNNNKIKWSNIFTWSEKEMTKILLRNYLDENKNKKLNLYDLTKNAYPIIEKHFVRKNWKDFDFLEVKITEGQRSWIFITVWIFTAIIIGYILFNGVDPEYKNITYPKYEQIKQNIKYLIKDFINWIKNKYFSISQWIKNKIYW